MIHIKSYSILSYYINKKIKAKLTNPTKNDIENP